MKLVAADSVLESHDVKVRQGSRLRYPVFMIISFANAGRTILKIRADCKSGLRRRSILRLGRGLEIPANFPCDILIHLNISGPTGKAKSLSQQDLAKLLDTSYTVIGKYERDEMKPSIDVANKLAKLVDTTVGYLLGESKNTNVLKDPAMLKRLNDINSFTEKEREHILYALDALIKNAKLNSISN